MDQDPREKFRYGAANFVVQQPRKISGAAETFKVELFDLKKLTQYGDLHVFDMERWKIKAKIGGS